MAPVRRVVLFLPGLPGGGAERVAVNILGMLPEVERHLVLMESIIEYPYDATLHILAGNPVGAGTLAQRSAAMARNVVAVRALKRRLGDATWLSFTTWANVLNVATGGDGRIILSSHSHESSNILGRTAPLLRGLVRLTYPRADLVVAVSESVKEDLVTTFGVPASRIRTIYNSVDLAAARILARAPLDREISSLLEHPTIVTAGALREPKGQWHLIRAFAEIKRLRPRIGARLLLLGKGPLGSYLAQLARESGLQTWTEWEGTSRREMSKADVVFVGFVSNPFAYFARAAVFAFPSLWEGFGNVILEAMACGALVVTADCMAGPREIVAPEAPRERRLVAPEYASSGILMPVLDGEKRLASAPLSATEAVWAETLSYLLEDRGVKARYEAPALARAREFSVEGLAQAWRETLLGQRQTPP